LAARLWPGGSALGRRLRFPDGKGGKVTVEVIGVVADTRVIKLWEPPAPLLYLPLAQNPFRLMTILVRGAGSGDSAQTLGLAAALRRELRRTHPEMAVLDVLP